MQSMVKKGSTNKVAQMKIQQMIFMILAVFLFFILVGLFVLKIQLGGIKGSVEDLNEAEAVNAMSSLAYMTELSCPSASSLCLDGDKLIAMENKDNYASWWSIASLEVLVVYPIRLDKNNQPVIIDCPGVNCNHYTIFDNGQEEIQKVSTYVSLCYQRMRDSQQYVKCEIAKVLVGVKELKN